MSNMDIMKKLDKDVYKFIDWDDHDMIYNEKQLDRFIAMNKDGSAPKEYAVLYFPPEKETTDNSYVVISFDNDKDGLTSEKVEKIFSMSYDDLKEWKTKNGY